MGILLGPVAPSPSSKFMGNQEKRTFPCSEESWKTHPHHSDSSPSVRQTRFPGNPDTALVAMRYLATSGGNPQRSHIFERSGSSLRLSTQFSSKSSHPMVNTPWIQESPNRPIVDILLKLVISHCHFTLPQSTAPFMGTQLQNSQETLQPGWVPYIYHGEFACQVMETPEKALWGQFLTLHVTSSDKSLWNYRWAALIVAVQLFLPVFCSGLPKPHYSSGYSPEDLTKKHWLVPASPFILAEYFNPKFDWWLSKNNTTSMM